ncbi:MAG: hypothetical protein HWN66_10325, partial [Candidatus Helarchaeota archaeon]|nr:hypothetical protein [Candidatus Helarchaeota archaeon]
MSKPSLWKVEELTDYQRKLDSELPPLYDFEQVRPVHREIESVILEYYALLHPVIQDFIYSWFLLWTNLKKKNEELFAEILQKSSMISNYRSNSETKIKSLGNLVNINQFELKTVKENLQQKELKLQELEGLDKEKQLGISNLRIELEKELAELNLRLSEMQTRF